MNLKMPLCTLLLALPFMSSFSEIVGKGILVAKVIEDGKPLFVIGNMTNRKPPLDIFLKSAHVATNLVGVSEWVSKTNLGLLTVVVATPEMFNPAATNVVTLSAKEWKTIFNRKPGKSGGADNEQPPKDNNAPK